MLNNHFHFSDLSFCIIAVVVAVDVDVLVVLNVLFIMLLSRSSRLRTDNYGR